MPVQPITVDVVRLGMGERVDAASPGACQVAAAAEGRDGFGRAVLRYVDAPGVTTTTWRTARCGRSPMRATVRLPAGAVHRTAPRADQAHRHPCGCTLRSRRAALTTDLIPIGTRRSAIGELDRQEWCKPARVGRPAPLATIMNRCAGIRGRCPGAPSPTAGTTNTAQPPGDLDHPARNPNRGPATPKATTRTTISPAPITANRSCNATPRATSTPAGSAARPR